MTAAEETCRIPRTHVDGLNEDPYCSVTYADLFIFSSLKGIGNVRSGRHVPPPRYRE
jgi:hypothetical protein